MDDLISFALKEDFLDTGGALTYRGRNLLRVLIERLPQVHKGRWGELFVPLMSRMVPVAVELVIVRKRQALLVHREDEFWNGWYTPGTYLGPRESWQQAAERCAGRELAVPVRVTGEPLRVFSCPENRRFHDLCVLLPCEITGGEPQAGQWFSEMPADIIPEHRKYWPVIEQQFSA